MNIEKRKKTEQTTKNKQIQKIQFHSNKKKKKEIQEGVQYENKPASGSSNNFKNKN